MEELKALKLGKNAKVVLGIAVAAVFLVEFIFQRQTFLSLIVTLFVFAELCIAYRFGPGLAVIAGTVSGLILALPKGEVGYVSVFCVIGLLVGIFRPLGKIISITAFLSGAMGVGVVYSPELLYELIPQLLAGAAMFFLIPKTLLENIPDFSVQSEGNALHTKEADQRKKREIDMRLLEQARMYQDLGAAFDTLPMEREIFLQVAGTIMEGQKKRARYREKARFEMLHGIARAVGQREFISGDNYSYYRLPSGKCLVMLSDGMGSGTQAFKDSDQVIGRMEQLLEAGFSLKTATGFVHKWLIAQERQDVGTTLDAGVIDLYSGEGEFIKAGAAATYLLRRSPARQVYDEQNALQTEYSYRAELLSAESTPLGILEELHTGSYKLKLRDGDILVMMTDGVLDAVSGEQKEERMGGFLEYEIGRLREVGKNDLASVLSKDILDFAVSDGGDELLRDDMTILTISIWENDCIC